MAHYVISRNQFLGTVVAIAIFVGGVTILLQMVINYLDTPEVHLNSSRECVKVVNFKNGDAFQCRDRDVTLRTYRIVHVH